MCGNFYLLVVLDFFRFDVCVGFASFSYSFKFHQSKMRPRKSTHSLLFQAKEATPATTIIVSADHRNDEKMKGSSPSLGGWK